jgi:hypothetical protein
VLTGELPGGAPFYMLKIPNVWKFTKEDWKGMDENEVVKKDVCKILHKQVDEKFIAIDCCIKEISDAVNEMKEISAGNKEIINMLMEERKWRIEHENKLEDIKPPELSENQPKDKYAFWNTKAGQLIPWLVFAFGVLIVVALVGTNLIEAWQQVKNYIPMGG